MRRILPFSSPCPPATVEPNSALRAFTIAPDSMPCGRVERGERVAVVARRDQGQAQRLRRLARDGGQRGRVAHQRVHPAHRLHGGQRGAQGDHVRDGGRERGLPARLRLALAAQVEVEARPARALSMRVQARALTRRRRRGPGGRASAFWLPTTTTSTPQACGLEGQRARAGDRVHDEQRVRAAARDAGQGLDVVGGARRGLVELDEDGADARDRRRGRAPTSSGATASPHAALQLLDVHPVRLADARSSARRRCPRPGRASCRPARGR